ncbi:MAG: rRNA maturation RNase YbeY [Clostridia bacterium]|nr:rRNA maturation RNase YbeY [Clostridia bacterium]
MPLELSIEVNDAPADLEAFLNRVLEACMKVEGLEKAFVAGRIVDDPTIRALNAEFRGIDRATDVLSFPAVTYPPGMTARGAARLLKREGWYLGDFALSLEHARAQAEEYGHSVRREIGYLTAHSIFHLCGYDHMLPEEQAVMRQREEAAMRLLLLQREEEESE